MSEILNDDKMICAHLGDEYNKYLNAVVPPIFMNSLHTFDTIEDYLSYDSEKEDQYIYGRDGNPTVNIVERKIAALERGKKALVFASGMAAATSAIMGVCKKGSHIIAMKDIYQPVKQFLNNVCIARLGMKVTYVKGEDIAEIEQAILPETTLMILESPATFVFSVVDLREISKLAKKHGIKTYIDNSYCTPIYQKPLEMGIDLVMHTASKYLGGHSDIIGGVLVSKDVQLMKQIESTMRQWYGGIIGPMEAWLIMRGLRTLDIRVEAHKHTAIQVASYLEKHSKVKQVYYPGLESHPQYELIKSQQTGSTGLMSFELDSDPENALKLINQLRVFKIGCSWGGFESLALTPLYKSAKEELEFLGVNKGLIRIHCGLEGAENLLEDLEKSLRSL